MKAEDVPDAWVKAARDGWWPTKDGGEKAMAAALAAVIPLIQAEERERIAGFAKRHAGNLRKNRLSARADEMEFIERFIRSRGEP